MILSLSNCACVNRYGPSTASFGGFFLSSELELETVILTLRYCTRLKGWPAQNKQVQTGLRQSNVTERKRAPPKNPHNSWTSCCNSPKLDMCIAFLYKNTSTYHPPKRILITFAVIISLDALCLPVFANHLKQPTPSKSGTSIQPSSPLTQRATTAVTVSTQIQGGRTPLAL